MKNYNTYSFSIIVVFLTAIMLFSGKPAHAQYDRTLNFLPIVPQGRNINPGFIPDHKFYIGVPLLSSVKTGFENSINYEDVFLRKGDSLILDRDHILSNFDDKTNLNINLMEEYFTFGFKVKKNYFHFRMADILQTNFVVNSNILRFLLYGNGSDEFLGQNVDLGGNAINATYYREYAFGYSRQINQKLTVGTTLKYLQGIANITTANDDISLFTDPTDFTLTMTSNIEINLSAPGIGEDDFAVEDLLPNSKNGGFAFDLGADYKINEKFDAFASLVNVGSIKWNENVTNYVTKNPQKPFVYEGFDINEYFENNTFDNDRLENILDSIGDEIGIVETSNAYKSKLAPILNLGGSFNLTEKDMFSALFRNRFQPNQDWTNFSLAYTRKFTPGLNLMLSNTMFKDSFFNPGIGFAANLGPVQLYLVNENVVAPFMLNNSNIFLVRFGINLIFKDKLTTLDEDDVEILNSKPDQGVE